VSDATSFPLEPFPSRQFWIRRPGEGEIREVEIPGHLPGHLRIRAQWSGISRGTESLVFRGEVPPSLHGTMRAPFQEGEFPAPVKYGYASVGQVEAAVLETALPNARRPETGSSAFTPTRMCTGCRPMR
jgi:hypothetical protein